MGLRIKIWTYVFIIFFEQDFFKQLQTILSRPNSRLVLWSSSQIKYWDWKFLIGSLRIEKWNLNSVKFRTSVIPENLLFVQILCVFKRKETIFKGDYGNSSLAKRLLLIQLIWIMNPKQRVLNDSTYRHWATLTDRFPIMQHIQGRRKFFWKTDSSGAIKYRGKQSFAPNCWLTAAVSM